MKEYKVFVLEPSELQKRLNQWRHEYNIEILHANAVVSQVSGTSKDVYISCIITREKRNEKLD